MSKSEDIWPLPRYNPGQAKHLHALGVIAVLFAQLERSVESLYHAEAERKKIPNDLINLYFYTLNEEKRIDAIRLIYADYKKKYPQMYALIGNLLDYFVWCRHSRNQVLHAENYPASFGGDPETLYLIERIGKQDPRSGYMRFKVEHLRSIADRIRDGVMQSATIEIRLRYLDVSPSMLPRPYREIVQEPFPDPLRVPKYLRLHPHP
jgi:hypothetical protein